MNFILRNAEWFLVIAVAGAATLLLNHFHAIPPVLEDIHLTIIKVVSGVSLVLSLTGIMVSK